VKRSNGKPSSLKKKKRGREGVSNWQKGIKTYMEATLLGFCTKKLRRVLPALNQTCWEQ